MSSGLPAITTSLSGASEVMEGGLKQLILKNPQDASGLAKIITKLTDESLRNKLAKGAREIAKNYTLEANAKAIETLCIKTIEEKQNG